MNRPNSKKVPRFRLLRRLVKGLYGFAVRLVYGRTYRSSANISDPARLLVIRTDGMGDFILFTPTLKKLRQVFDQHRISLVVNDEWADLAESCPYVDEIIPWNYNRYARYLLYRFAFLRRLHARRFQTAFCSVSERYPYAAELLSCSGALQHFGRLQVPTESKALLHHLGTDSPAAGKTHAPEVLKNLRFLESVCGVQIEADGLAPEVWLTEGDRSRARTLLSEAGLKAKQDLVIAFFPGARASERMWPMSCYAALGNALIEKYKSRIAICGSRKEGHLATEIATGMSYAPIVLAGKTTLRELAAVMASCDLYIGSETGPLHLAAAMGTPTLCIMGGGHFGRFYPYGDLNKHRMVFKKMDCYHCNWECIHETTRCIQEIAVEEVWQAVQQLFEEVILPQRLVQRNGDREKAEMQ